MMDISTLVDSLTNAHAGNLADGPWADMLQGKRKVNAPPVVSLMPGQQAVADAAQGANEAHQAVADAPIPNTDAHDAEAETAGPSNTQKVGGLLGSLGKSLSSQPVDNSQSTQPFLFNNPQYNQAISSAIASGTQSQPIQFRAFGGALDPDARTVVGEDGPEVILPSHGGDVVVPLDPNDRAAHPDGVPMTASVPSNADQPIVNTALSQPVIANTTPDASVDGSVVNPADQPIVQNPAMNAAPVTGVPTTQPSDANQPIQGLQGAATGIAAAMPTVPNIAGVDPIDQQIQGLQQQRQQALNSIHPAGRFGNIGAAVLQSTANYFNGENRPVMTLDQIRYNRAVRPIDAKIAAMQNQKALQARTDYEISQAQRNEQYSNYIGGKNQTAEDIAGMKYDADRAKNLATQQRLGTNGWYRTHQRFDPATASTAEVNQLKAIGETPESMGKYDYTDKKVHTIAGHSYKENPQTGAYEDVGLPTNRGQEVIDTQVTDPTTGVKYTYTTTREKTAQLQNDLIRTGMTVDGANSRNQASINAANDRQTQKLKQQHDEFITNTTQKYLNDMRGLANDQEKAAEYKATFIQKVNNIADPSVRDELLNAIR